MMHDWATPWHGGAGWGAWLVFALLCVVVVAVVVAIVFLLRAASPTSAPTVAQTPESPRDILQRRYAAGEIDREEYLQKLADL